MLHTTTKMVAMTMILRMAMITRTLDHQDMMNSCSLLALLYTNAVAETNKDNDNQFETC